MKILSAQFIKGVVDEESILYDGTPHIAFIGRSNVGKSSTLNSILERKKLVKTGRTPGKTREINFFKVTTDSTPSESYFVDLPGYGYAKLSKKERSELDSLIRWYITHPEADTALICVIIDAKTGITELDEEYIQLLKSHRKIYCIAVNKIDKINQKAQYQLEKSLRELIPKQTLIFYYSAVKGKQIHKLRDFIFKGKV